MFRSKTFMHCDTGKGIEEIEFSKAEASMNDLISDSWQSNVATADKKNMRMTMRVMIKNEACSPSWHV
nr:unnamed protein product [Callosobruchus chinensis]